MINLTKLKVTGKPKRTGLPLRKTKISQRCLWACSSAGASHAPLATASSSAAPFPFLCCLPVALLHFSHNLLLTAVVLSPKTSGIPLPMIINLTLPSFAPFTLWGTLRGGLHKLLPGCSFMSCFELFDYRGSTKELCFWNSSKWSAVPKVQVPQILVLSDSPHCYFFAILLKKNILQRLRRASSPLSISPGTASFLTWSDGTITVPQIETCRPAGNLFQQQ